ncbi:MAG: hydrogenase small subunit [Actinobacteria bacterium]|nr:hydrogenase small subunit [Actinomycetota bacterium]MBE3113906.1 hydrogenase small subunit [Actinomycetota bacterium]
MNTKKSTVIPVINIQGQNCTGCATSILCSEYPSIKNILLQDIIPGFKLEFIFHPNIMTASGNLAMEILENTAKEKGYVLIIDGAIPTGSNGIYCITGEKDGRKSTILEETLKLAPNALLVIALGTCAAFGGIAAGNPNPTGAQSVGDIFLTNKIKTPLINVPGCPPHPDWLFGTIEEVLTKGLENIQLDDFRRPKTYYGKLIHENCPNRAYFDEGKFARKLGDEGCLYELGCKGSITYADCPKRQWNGRTNWVIGSGAPCNGCTSPEYPDFVGDFYERIIDVEVPANEKKAKIQKKIII